MSRERGEEGEEEEEEQEERREKDSICFLNFIYLFIRIFFLLEVGLLKLVFSLLLLLFIFH